MTTKAQTSEMTLDELLEKEVELLTSPHVGHVGREYALKTFEALRHAIRCIEYDIETLETESGADYQEMLEEQKLQIKNYLEGK